MRSHCLVKKAVGCVTATARAYHRVRSIVESRGGIGKMYKLCGDQMDSLIDELNGELVA